MLNWMVLEIRPTYTTTLDNLQTEQGSNTMNKALLIHTKSSIELAVLNEIFMPLAATASILAGWSVAVQPVRAATFISFTSQPGDYIGGGLSQTFTPADGDFFSRSTYGSLDNITVGFNNFSRTTNPQNYKWWDLEFAAPRGQTLVPGIYEGATRVPFRAPTEPGIDISGEGRGCNTLTGRFVVNEAVYRASGSVERFSADFEQHCEGAKPALFGQVRYNSSESVPEPGTVAGLFLLGLGGVGGVLKKSHLITGQKCGASV